MRSCCTLLHKCEHLSMNMRYTINMMNLIYNTQRFFGFYCI